jgi:hypothetical protein
MRAIVTRDAEVFAERVGAFLAERPVEHNVLATVLDQVRSGAARHAEPFFAWVETGEVVAAALRTPRLAEPGDRDRLVEWASAFDAETGARLGSPDVAVDDRLRARGYASALDAQEYFFDLRSD